MADRRIVFVFSDHRQVDFHGSRVDLKKLLEIGKSLFGRLRPSVSLDDTGKPRIDFGVDGRAASKNDLVEVLAAPQTLAEKTGRTVVMVFDEFQQILEYDDDVTERQIRSSIQHHTNVAYVFLGSRKHLLQSMFLGESGCSIGRQCTIQSGQLRRSTGTICRQTIP